MKSLFHAKSRLHLADLPGRLHIGLTGLFRLPRTNLSIHLMAIIFGAVVLGMAGSSLVSLGLQHDQLIEDAQLAAQRMSSMLLTNLEHAMRTNDRSMIDQMVATSVGETGIERIRVIDGRGSLYASSVRAEIGQSPSLAAAPCNGCHVTGAPPAAIPAMLMMPDALLHEDKIPNRQECHACHDPQAASLGILLIETPMAELQARLSAGLSRLLLSVAVTLGMLAVLLVRTLRQAIFDPVRRLVSATSEIGAGNLDYPASLDRADELGQLGQAFDQMRLRLKEAHSHLEERNQELRMLNDVARAASELLDPQQILELAINLVASSPGIAGGGIFLQDPECGRLRLGACRGVGEMDCLHAGLQLQAQRRHAKDGVLVVSANGSGVATEPWPDERWWVCVPLMAKAVEVGSLALITRPGQRPSEQGIGILRAMAEEIGLALANALQYERVQYTAAIEERDRLAREMHDSLAQKLGYLKLKASLTDQLLASGEFDQAQTQLREVKAIAGETYTDVRETIFGLRHPQASGSEFLPALQDFLAEYHTYYDVDVQLVMGNGHRPLFTPAVSVQVTRIIQEALTNVRKHAGVKQAVVHMDLVDETWHITIEDQGRGFDPAEIRPHGPQFLGLQIMRERAESVGGQLELKSHPEHGTRIVLTVPANIKNG